jgi:hypothetical protein
MFPCLKCCEPFQHPTIDFYRWVSSQDTGNRGLYAEKGVVKEGKGATAHGCRSFFHSSLSHHGAILP